jgi:hypothetical protein
LAAALPALSSPAEASALRELDALGAVQADLVHQRVGRPPVRHLTACVRMVLGIWTSVIHDAMMP